MCTAGEWWCMCVCVCLTVGKCRRHSVNVHTSRTGAFWHNKYFRLLLAGIPAQETLVLVVLIVGAAHRGVVVVALQRGEEIKKTGEHEKLRRPSKHPEERVSSKQAWLRSALRLSRCVDSVSMWGLGKGQLHFINATLENKCDGLILSLYLYFASQLLSSPWSGLVKWIEREISSTTRTIHIWIMNELIHCTFEKENQNENAATRNTRHLSPLLKG